MTHPHTRHVFGDPYQQHTIQVSPSVLWGFVLGGTTILAYLIHRLLLALDYPILSITEVLWNCFVWFMPSSLVFGLGHRIAAPKDGEAQHSEFSGVSEHAAKSEVLRRVFKLEKSQKPTSSFGESPAGLGNWDNSCYQNSVLQALASVRCLRTFFEDLSRNIHYIPEDSTVVSLDRFISSLNDLGNSGRHLWTPYKLKSMSSWQQQDAQEYFSKLVDSIEKDTASALKRKREVFLENGADSIALGTTSTNQEPNISETIQQNRISRMMLELNPIQNPLEGLLAQRVGCTRCGYCEGMSLIPFNCITLPLGKQWEYSIEDCLSEFAGLEAIDGVECAKCTLLQIKKELQCEMEMGEELGHEHANDENESDAPLDYDNYETLLREDLDAVTTALRDEDFSEETLLHKCRIPNDERVTSTKSKQVAIMKPPQCLVLHVNRSVFDESTGAQLKNYADFQYPMVFDIQKWCVGSKVGIDSNDSVSPIEEWEMDPEKSMIYDTSSLEKRSAYEYQLSAIITHLGRHENGHYVCYRKLPNELPKFLEPEEELNENYNGFRNHAWWRLSDENVVAVSEEEAVSQGSAYMLFYERIIPQCSTESEHAPMKIDEGFTSSTLSATSAEDEEKFGHSVSVEEGGKQSESLEAVNSLLTPDSEPPQRTADRDEEANQEHATDSSDDETVGNASEEVENAPSRPAMDAQNHPPSLTKMRTAGIHHSEPRKDDSFHHAPMVATS